MPRPLPCIDLLLSERGSVWRMFFFPARNLIDIDQGRARPSERNLVRRKAVVVVVTGLSPFLAAG